jgi:hypothetical protein
MPNAPPFFAHIHLLFALLTRWFGLWTSGKPPARLVRLMEHTGRTLADAIRATLREDGVAFPEMDDRAFLVWFKTNCPGAIQAPPAPLHRMRGRGWGGGFSESEFAATVVKRCGKTADGACRPASRFAPTPAPPPHTVEGRQRAPP